MGRYIKREDAVFAACKVLDKFGGCKMGPLCPDVGCSEVRDIIDTFQMIEIPKQHGRLIDADALMKEFEKAQRTMEQNGREYSCSFMSDSRELSTEWYCVEDMLDNAPTIIPAEEGE